VLTTQALEISAYQDLIDNITEMNLSSLQNPEVADLFYRAFNSTDELTDVENFRMARSAFIRFRHGDMAFFQYQRGAIDEARLRSVLNVMRIDQPRMREAWENSKHYFVPAYREYIDQLIAETDANMAHAD
jgi:hypothetical protein